MFATAGGQFWASSPLTFSLFFARQPEPDLEFTEEELEQTANVRAASPMKPPKNKKSGGRPVFWLLLLVLIGGGTFFAMEPEMVMDLVGPLLGETPAPPPSPIARKPAPPAPPIPNTPPAQPQASVPAPVAPQTDSPQVAIPAPAPIPAPDLAQTSAPAMPNAASLVSPAPVPPAMANRKVPVATAPAAEPLPPIIDSPDPLFGEGQRVTLLPSPSAPREKVALMKDAAGTKPGLAVPPGTNFTILDGDLQERGWVYYVRSDYGTKGWLNEKQLRAKR